MGFTPIVSHNVFHFAVLVGVVGGCGPFYVHDVVWLVKYDKYVFVGVSV